MTAFEAEKVRAEVHRVIGYEVVIPTLETFIARHGKKFTESSAFFDVLLPHNQEGYRRLRCQLRCPLPVTCKEAVDLVVKEFFRHERPIGCRG